MPDHEKPDEQSEDPKRLFRLEYISKWGKNVELNSSD